MRLLHKELAVAHPTDQIVQQIQIHSELDQWDATYHHLTQNHSECPIFIENKHMRSFNCVTARVPVCKHLAHVLVPLRLHHDSTQTVFQIVPSLRQLSEICVLHPRLATRIP